MRKIILMISVSLDGYFEGPNREIDWHMVDEELHEYFNRYLETMSVMIHGRVTYELMAGYWPTADQDPEAAAPTKEFARIWRDAPKIVYSRSLRSAGWNTTIVREVVPSDVEALKAQPGADMVLGGPNLAATFMRHNLIDEYHICVHPVVIGEGHPLFSHDTRLALRLLESRTFGNGVVLLRYAPT